MSGHTRYRVRRIVRVRSTGCSPTSGSYSASESAQPQLLDPLLSEWVRRR